MTLSRRNWIILGVVALVVIAWWALRRPGERQSPAEQAPLVNASLAEVRLEPVETLITDEGTVRPRMVAVLSPKIMSTVSQVLVREGDHVRAGQPLVRLEARDLAANVAQADAALSAASASAQSAWTAATMDEQASRAQIRSAKAAVQQAQAQLSIVQEGARKQERAQASLAVEQAKAQYDLAASELQRMQRLYQQDVVTKQRLEQTQAAERVAMAAWQSAKQQASMVAEGSRKEDIRGAQERLRQAQAGLSAAEAGALSARMRREQAKAASKQTQQAGASLQAAETAASYSVIRAPFSGVVTIRSVDPGDQVGPGSPLLTVEDTSEWRLEADVPESQAVNMKAGDPALARIDALGTATLPAHILEVRPSGDPSTRTVHVKALLPHDARLKSGLFGRLILREGSSRAILVPTSAIVDPEGIPRVWLVSDSGVAELRVVTLGDARGEQTVVLSGLSQGQHVAISNLDALSNGARVTGGK